MHGPSKLGGAGRSKRSDFAGGVELAEALAESLGEDFGGLTVRLADDVPDLPKVGQALDERGLEGVSLPGERVLRGARREQVLHAVGAGSCELGRHLDLAANGRLITLEGALARRAHGVEILPLARDESVDVETGDLEGAEILAEIWHRGSRLGWAWHRLSFRSEGKMLHCSEQPIL